MHDFLLECCLKVYSEKDTGQQVSTASFQKSIGFPIKSLFYKSITYNLNLVLVFQNLIQLFYVTCHFRFSWSPYKLGKTAARKGFVIEF